MSLYKTPLVTPKLTLDNRLVFPAMNTSSAAPDGAVTDATRNYFRERSKGFGLVVLEHACVSAWGKAGNTMLSISRDEDIPGLASVVEVLHGNGCKAAIQLDHGGGWTIPELQNTLNPKLNPEGRRITDHITDQELEQVVEDFGGAAVRAMEAGFDMVEIKACHVYLLAQFYSPLTNARTQGRYVGTTFQGRTQLIMDVLQSVRKAVGPDFPIAVRFALQDYDPAGSTLEEGIRLGEMLEEAGADLLDLSGGPKYRYFHPTSKEPGYFGPDAKAVRQGRKIPVIVAGGVTTPQQAEDLLQQGCTDLVGVCRAAVRDPQWARKAMAEIEEDN